MDVYHNVSGLKKSFKQFIEQVKNSGSVIYCYDDLNIREVIGQIQPGKSIVSYGVTEESDFYAQDRKSVV